MESDHWMYKNLSWMQVLLCGDYGEAITGHGSTGL